PRRAGPALGHPGEGSPRAAPAPAPGAGPVPPLMTYRDKVVLVTGASKGIGEGCVRVFVEAGAKVVFCARGERAGRALESNVNAKGPGTALFLPCDVSKVDQVTGVVDETVKRYHRLDCLINNAGWHPPHKPIDDYDVQEF